MYSRLIIGTGISNLLGKDKETFARLAPCIQQDR